MTFIENRMDVSVKLSEMDEWRQSGRSSGEKSFI